MDTKDFSLPDRRANRGGGRTQATRSRHRQRQAAVQGRLRDDQIQGGGFDQLGRSTGHRHRLFAPTKCKLGFDRRSRRITCSTEGVKASFVLTQANGKIHISGRSMGDISVQLILEKIGGGGSLDRRWVQLEKVWTKRRNYYKRQSMNIFTRRNSMKVILINDVKGLGKAIWSTRNPGTREII